MNLHTVKAYSTAIRLGSKYTYQMIPRLLTLWLDMGEDQLLSQGDAFNSINNELKKAVAHTPVYKACLSLFPLASKNNNSSLPSIVADCVSSNCFTRRS